MDINEGGTAIPYWMEDPHIRDEFEAKLKAAGGESRMGNELYAVPNNDDPKPDRKFVQS